MPETITERVELAELSARRIQVAVSPLETLFMLVMEALRPDPYRAHSPELRSAIQSTLPPTVKVVLAPLLAPYRRWPDCLVPAPDHRIRTLDDALEKLADTSAEELLCELAAERLEETEEWRPVVRNPRGWLVLYIEALRRAWEPLKTVWGQAAAHLDYEQERVGAAAARDFVPELVAGFSDRTSVRDGVWLIPGARPRRVHIPDDGLVVVPLLTGPRVHARRYDDNGRLTHFEYPVATARAVDPSFAPSSQLASLLGRPRAAILRLLDRPMTSGGVARAVEALPSTASYHLVALEEAGLVVRHRDGRNTVVDRTLRGEALLSLFDDT